MAIPFDGVLSKRGTVPHPDGVDLVRSLTSMSKVWLLAGSTDIETVRMFNVVHRVSGLAEVVTHAQPGDEPLVLRQILSLRSNGSRLDMAVVPDPTLLAPLLERRISALLFLPSGSVPPKWLPHEESGKAAWKDIEKALDERVRHEGVSERG